MFYTCVEVLGNNILYRGYDSHGDRVQKKVPFSPTLYINTHENTETKALDGTPVKPISFDTIKEARDFVKRYEDVDNIGVYGNRNFVSQFIQEKYPNDITFDRSKIKIAFIDIEVDSSDGFPEPSEARHEVTAICLCLSTDGIFHVWGCGEYTPDSPMSDVVYHHCSDEKDLLRQFIAHWSTPINSPDVISGWNTNFFDVPYLINRIMRVLSEKHAKQISPWGICRGRTTYVNGKPQESYDIYGIQQLDYMDVFKKFALSYPQQESYSLDHISHVVLGENKISYDEYSSLHNLYRLNYTKFIDYNIHDTRLVLRLDQKLDLISIVLTMAYKSGVNYKNTLGTTMKWDTIIYRHLAKKNIVVPPERKDVVSSDYRGGYVKEVDPQVVKWVTSFDVNSMYPNIIVQWNMSPETFIEGKRFDYDVDTCLDPNFKPNGLSEHETVAANGAVFDTSKIGTIPEIVKMYYDERKAVRAEMQRIKERQNELSDTGSQEYHENNAKINTLDNNQLSIKLLLNSLYGGLGTKYFRYYRVEIAEAVTLTGQFIIRCAGNALNKKLNRIMDTESKEYMFYSDTDSCYVTLDDLVKKTQPKDPVSFIDAVGKNVLEKELDKEFSRIHDLLNCRENRQIMKREVISDSAIWLSKKRYIMNVLDTEGVRHKEPYLKVMGVEAVKSSTPQICREALKNVMKTILRESKDKAITEIRTFKDMFLLAKPEEVSFPRGVSDIEKWQIPTGYLKGTPIHAKAAIVYNRMLRSNDLTHKYSVIKSGDKMKFCYLKTPNHVGERVIGFPNYLPPEFKLDLYIDKEMQFEKTFMSAITPILDAAGIVFSDTQSLDDFFN